MKAGIFKLQIEKIEDMGAQETRHFTLRFDPDTHFDFKAGQFVSIFVPTEEKTIKRAYSIDSPPEWTGSLDLCWKKVHLGLATGYLWGLKEGDRIQIQGPLGHFTLREPLPKKIVFVSTGTGIAPFRSMAHHLLAKKADCEIVNIFGNRFAEDIFYREEFEKLAKENANFHNVFTVSRPKEGTWDGETQYVQELLPKYVKSTDGTHIYICGLSAMTTEVQKTALEMGFQKEQVFFEKYD